jgi:transcription termination factor Rho
MKVTDIRSIAKEMGIKNTSKMKKNDLIHSIQRTEGNSDCYGISWRHQCGQQDCRWRQDCLAE